MGSHTDVAAFQMIYAVREFEDYLKKMTGRSFKLRKPLVSDGPNKMIAKFVIKKGGDVDGISYWPMFRFVLEYDLGADEYRVETNYWDDLKLGKPVARWESGGTMPLENVFNPRLVFGPIIAKAKDRLEKDRGRGSTLAANQASHGRTQGKAKPREYEIRMPMMQFDRKMNQTKLVYAVYRGKEATALASSPATSRGVRFFSVKGRRGGTFEFVLYPDGAYKMFSWGKKTPIATGTVRDKYAPEIIAR